MENNFPVTSWTLLDAACDDNTEGAAALEEFSKLYYAPVNAFFSALLYNSDEDPDDHTQTFFISKLLSRKVLKKANRAKGSFRHYLKQILRNYCRDLFRKKKIIIISLDDDEHPPIFVKDDPRARADAAYHEAWVRTLLDKAMEIVKERCLKSGQKTHYDLFVSRYLSTGSKAPSWQELGNIYGLDQKKARSRAETVARQLKTIIKRLLIEDTHSEAAASEELATLAALLGDS